MTEALKSRTTSTKVALHPWGTRVYTPPKWKALLIGEAHNPKLVHVDHWDQVAAFYPYPMHGSGMWLRQALASHTLSDWTFELENSVTLDRIINRFNEFHAVVALSRTVAQAFCLPYHHHPAYYKRFIDPYGYEAYARDLKLTLNMIFNGEDL